VAQEAGRHQILCRGGATPANTGLRFAADIENRRHKVRDFPLPQGISFPHDDADALAAHSCGIGEAASGLDAAPKREHDADASGLNPKFVTEGAATYRELRKRAVCSSGV
jgi:hypothetical protein